MRWRIKGFRIAKHAKGFVCITQEEKSDGGRRRRRLTLEASNKWAAGTEASDLVGKLRQSEPKENLNVSQIVALYLEQTEAISKQDMIYHFKPVLEMLGPMTPDAITEEVCKRYAGDRKRSAGTIRVELGLLNTALKWAKKHKKIAEAPWVWMPPAPPPRDRTLTREEANRLIEACDKNHVRLFVTLALNTAGRASALLGLRWQMVDLHAKKLDLGGTGRQKRRAYLPINPTLHAALTEAKEASLTPFVIEWAGKPIKDINRSFNLAVKNAGLDRKVTPHVLRHTAASWMAMQRVPFEEIAQFLGHTNPALTFKVYAKFHPDYLQEAAKALG
jgi:integrase